MFFKCLSICPSVSRANIHNNTNNENEKDQASHSPFGWIKKCAFVSWENELRKQVSPNPIYLGTLLIRGCQDRSSVSEARYGFITSVQKTEKITHRNRFFQVTTQLAQATICRSCSPLAYHIQPSNCFVYILILLKNCYFQSVLHTNNFLIIYILVSSFFVELFY